MSYKKQIQTIIDGYSESAGDEPTTTHEMAAWAVSHGLWQPQHSSLINQCAAELARVLRERTLS